MLTAALIGGGISAASGIASSILAAREAKKAEAELGKQKANLDNWYDITSNRDYTQTAEAQSAITAARDLMQQQYLAGKGAAAVSGATGAEAARMKAAANDVAAKTIDSIAARGSQIKTEADAKYLAGQQTLSDKEMALHQQKAANIQKAGESLSNAAVGITSAYMGAYNDKE